MDWLKARGGDLFQNLAKKIGLSVHGDDNRKDKNEECKSVTEILMTENVDDVVIGWVFLKNDSLIVKLVDDKGVDDYGEAKSVNTKHHISALTFYHTVRGWLTMWLNKWVVSIIIVFTTPIPIPCIYTEKAGFP